MMGGMKTRTRRVAARPTAPKPAAKLAPKPPPETHPPVPPEQLDEDVGQTLVWLTKYVRLSALDALNWKLQALEVVQDRQTQKRRLKWKDRGYYSRTLSGLRAAARLAAEMNARELGESATVPEVIRVFETVYNRFDELVARWKWEVRSEKDLGIDEARALRDAFDSELPKGVVLEPRQIVRALRRVDGLGLYTKLGDR